MDRRSTTQRRIWPASLYAFLAFIEGNREDGSPPPRILDCGAGGKRPPLGLFYEHGYQSYGIDFSERQVQLAKQFCQESGMDLRIQKGDMRHIPFEDAFFDRVYEYDSLWRLTKRDAGLATREMHRVLRKGGLCFVSFVSSDCWPLEGREEHPGEFWFTVTSSLCPGDEWLGASELVYSYYADDEIDRYLSGFEIARQEKRTLLCLSRNTDISREDWLERHRSEWTRYTRNEWADMYEQRIVRYRWVRTGYILRKS